MSIFFFTFVHTAGQSKDIFQAHNFSRVFKTELGSRQQRLTLFKNKFNSSEFLCKEYIKKCSQKIINWDKLNGKEKKLQSFREIFVKFSHIVGKKGYNKWFINKYFCEWA